jgi:hypothetical protein
MEGVCMLESNEETLMFVVVGLKGQITLFRVKTEESSHHDNVVIEWQCSIADILKQRNSNA